MADNTSPVLDIENLVRRFGERTVLRLVAWSVPRGGHSLVLGASGSGKSTLLHLIAGLLRPNEGRIAIDGKSLSDMTGRERDAFRGRHVGIVLQNFHLISALSLMDNLRLARSLAGEAPDVERLETLIEQLGLSALSMRKPDAISQGERQRAAIARALVNDPTLLLADEPTSALDDDNAERVIDLLLQQATLSGATLIVATHDQRITSHFESRLVLDRNG